MKHCNLRIVKMCIFHMIIAIVGGTLLLIAVYELPIEAIRENERESLVILNEEGRAGYYNMWAPEMHGTHLDMFTDPVMINEAATFRTGSAIHDAMLIPAFSGEAASMTDLLRSNLETDDPNSISYSDRYWHGYLIVLKPLLSVFSFAEIRILNMSIQLLLVCMCVVLFVKRGIEKYCIPFLLAVLVINPISSALCMTYAIVYSIMLLSTCSILCICTIDSNISAVDNTDMNCFRVFLWTGMATSFFDYLTFPLVSWGIPLITLWVLKRKFTTQNTKIINNLFICSIIWGFGYAGMWVSKWILSEILTGHNAFSEAINMVHYRLSGDTSVVGIESSLKNVLYLNFAQVVNKVAIYGVIVFSVVFFFLFVSGKVTLSIKPDVLVLAAVGIVPVLWYTLVRNHSAIHFWMTHRKLVY